MKKYQTFDETNERNFLRNKIREKHRISFFYFENDSFDVIWRISPLDFNRFSKALNFPFFYEDIFLIQLFGSFHSFSVFFDALGVNMNLKIRFFCWLRSCKLETFYPFWGFQKITFILFRRNLLDIYFCLWKFLIFLWIKLLFLLWYWGSITSWCCLCDLCRTFFSFWDFFHLHLVKE